MIVSLEKKDFMKLEVLNLHNFQTGEYFNTFPWFEVLKEIIENDFHHTQDSVFNHTVNVARSVEYLVAEKEIYSEYFNKKIQQNTRKQLLVISALFHDIGKSKTYSIVNDRTFFIGHEEESYKITNDLLGNIDISEIEKKYICRIVRNHGRLYPFLKVNNKNIENDFKKIEREVEYYSDLYLFVLADINGSQLKNKNIVMYNYLTNTINSRLENIFLNRK